MKLMKLFLLAVVLFYSENLLAQTNYDAFWKKVDELIEKKRLPKSALAEVKKIYSLAKKEKKDAQLVKSLVYTIGLQQETREEDGKEAIKEIEKEITTAKEPALSILKSLQANIYWQYFQNNRWKFYNRTNTVDFNKNDIATWTIGDFHKKISELYLQSIKKEELLKKIKLDAFDAIIIKGNLRNLRPTLYDLLAQEALDYFINDERDIQQPAYAFEISQQEAFAPASPFVNYKFTTRDSLSLQHKALLIYQELTQFHLNDQKPDALIDVEIQRIQFVYAKATMENKEGLYKKALEKVIEKYSSNPVTAQASFLLASYYNELASKYDAQKDSAHRYDRVKAKEILENVVKNSSVKSQGWINSYHLLKKITNKTFSFTVEKANLPNQPFRALVNYLNISTLHLRLIKATDALKKLLKNDKENLYWNTLVRANPIRSWSQVLPAMTDYQNHSVEIKIDALPAGEYLLLASYDETFDRKNNPLGARLFYVSNISYTNYNEEYFVLHRQTGEPLKNASVQIWEDRYDKKTEEYLKQKVTQYKTDDKGYFKFAHNKKTSYSYNYYLDITHNNERFFPDEAVYGYHSVIYDPKPDTLSDEQFEKQLTYTYLFTDRSIYRPGQTLLFKGISITNNKKYEKKIQANFETAIYLRDANYRVIDSLSVTTNEFGSFSGKFQLPQNTLNGTFHLYMKNNRGNATVNVEEYKRPKFSVEFEKIKETYKVNDTITLTGNAKAYAGNNIDKAKVSYRVTRKPRFIYDWFRRWQPDVQQMEIINGTVTTDATGKFRIKFKAIPDKTVSKNREPVFDYQVTVDVTDINGETRSNQTIISAGYKSLLLKVDLEERIAVDSLKNISIRTENLNGDYQSSMVTVSVFKLIPEKRLIRSRLWERPDQYIMSKDEFISYFPNDEYKSEADFRTWPRERQVYTRTDSTKLNSPFSIVNSQLTAGYYAIEFVTKDKDGQEVKDIKYVELFDPKSNQLTSPRYMWVKGLSGPVEPGEITIIQIVSSTKIFLVTRKDQPSSDLQVSYGVETINAEKKVFEYPVTEADRGGYGLNYFFVRDNRLYNFNHTVNIPWTNKELDIQFETFRDKTLPGSEEKWKVKISGYKNEKVAAEMLAGMYDASLDQFKFHKWNKPNLWSIYSSTTNWSTNNFQSVVSNQKWISNDSDVFPEWNYDRLGFELEDLIYGNSKRHIIRREMRSPDGLFMRANKIASSNLSKKYSAPQLNEVSVGLVGRAPGLQTNQDGVNDEFDSTTITQNSTSGNNQSIQPRKNFNETAFFFPDLRTDGNGNIEFSFTTPEALTKWKLQTLAHTKDLAFGFSQKEMVTQKELMVQPNMPRFLRQGDRLEMVTKVVNLSDKELTGQVQLELFDATSNQSVDGWFINSFPNQYFTVAAGQSELVKFPIQVPMQFNKALVWRITARSNPLPSGGPGWADAEENALPVLINKVLVTESLALPMRGAGIKNFTFKKLSESGESETLQHQSLTVEYTSNPAWYAVQALPYLMEYPYECSEQTWNRYYANALASKIANSSPRIKQIFDQWKTMDTAALLSNLQKNQELKSALLEETPWVLQAKTEEQQKKNIALLFDMVKMTNELRGNMNKLKELLNNDGSFPWFKGGRDDRYITQYILTGIGHLKKLDASVKGQEKDIQTIINDGLNYLDKKIREDYNNLIKYKANLTKQQISSLQIQYLYMRSFFPEKPIPQASLTACNFYGKQAAQFWKNQTKILQGMIALALKRTGDKIIPVAILKSLKETSITNEELGMYWKDNRKGFSWHWSYAPIETQALMIEVFSEINKDTKTVDDLRTWLIKNKQTNNWETTKATADACYAMLLQGTAPIAIGGLSTEPVVQIKLGTTTISNTDSKTEAGTGYFKQTIAGDRVQPAMGTISVSIQPQTTNNKPQTINSSWGSVYWQYFEDMDKVTTAFTPLQLTKKLFVEKNTDRGPVLSPVEEGEELHVGDKIKVRIELRVDRDMEYVHMKDMRASSLEPANVISGYKWQGGLGYYESTKDVSTNFFFNNLRKGTYVFEYSLFVSHTGNFSNGITTIQCMYAPEFSAHSEGIRIIVE